MPSGGPGLTAVCPAASRPGVLTRPEPEGAGIVGLVMRVPTSSAEASQAGEPAWSATSPGGLRAPSRALGRPGPVQVGSHRWWVALEFAGIIGFQVVHQVEHTLEVLQKRLGHPGLHPLLGGVNFEWAHFAGNTLLFCCIVAVVLAYGERGRRRWRETSRLAWTVLVTGIVVQGTHVIEHIVRIWQYTHGQSVPEGLATRWLDPVWFHWGINLVFLTSLLVGFFGLRVHRDLFGRAPARPAGGPTPR